LRGADAGAEVVQMSMVCGDCVLVHRVWQQGDLGVTLRVKRRHVAEAKMAMTIVKSFLESRE
jgi:hypothetical protein